LKVLFFPWHPSRIGGKLFVFKELISRQAAKGHKEKQRSGFIFIKPEFGRSV
jgi:hypothetical protein